jgi:predicted nucleic acid-binding protein
VRIVVVKVVDAPALAALLFSEPEGEMMAERLWGARLVAPALLSFEIANICLKKIRQHPAVRDALVAAFGLMARMEIETADADHAAILAVAERSGSTAHDASYLWLARRMGAELVTLDRQLAVALETTPAPPAIPGR